MGTFSRFKIYFKTLVTVKPEWHLQLGWFFHRICLRMWRRCISDYMKVMPILTEVTISGPVIVINLLLNWGGIFPEFLL